MRHQRPLAWLTLAVIATTTLWVILVIVGQATAEPVQTLTEKAATLMPLGPLFYVTYLNAALITLLDAALFALLYLLCRDEAPAASLVGLVCVPMYGLSNLIAYLSQIILVPHLLRLYQAPETTQIARALLGLSLQDWPGSAVSALNLGAYALLGIPSILYAVPLASRLPGLRLGAGLLTLSGVLSLLAFAGVIVGSAVLQALTLVSGFIFLAALIMMDVRFFQTGEFHDR
jgi:hypothetical protein